MKLSDQYIAGFFDGEGCIHIGSQLHSWCNNPTYVLSVIVGQVRTDVISVLYEEYGGTFRKCTKKNDKSDRYSWVWKISGKTARDFLLRIRPFLIQKGEEADVAFRFCEHKDAYDLRSLVQLGQQGTVERVLREREQMKQQLSALKKPKLDPARSI